MTLINQLLIFILFYRKIYFVTYYALNEINYDGSEFKIVLKGIIGYPIAYDKLEGRLYFNNLRNRTIASIKPDGTDYKDVLNVNLPWVIFSIVIVDEYIYFTNWRVRGIGRALKRGGLNNTYELLRQDVFSMMNQIIFVNSSYVPKRSSCPVGHCEQLCFLSKCFCANGYKLYNETNCELIPVPTTTTTPSKPTLPFTTRIGFGRS